MTGGRTGLAILTVFALVMTLFAVFGEGTAYAGPNGDCSEAQNWQSFTFVFENGHVFSGDNCPGSDYAPDQDGNNQDAFLPGTGGATAALDGPGMTLHTSCSEVYEDGWATSGNQPDPAVDTAWKIASFHIEKHHTTKGVHQICDQPWVTTTTTTQPTTTTTLATTTTTQPTTTTTQATTTTTQATTTTTQATTTTTQATTTTTILGTTITSPTSTLPFTGIESEQMVGIAIMLLGSGVLLTLAGMGRREEA